MDALTEVIGQARILEWQDQAVCRETDPDAFFPEPRDRAFSVKTICSECPVRGLCLEYSFVNNEPYGIWGGVSPDERKHFKRIGLPMTNEGVDRWFNYKYSKRMKLRERYKIINNKYS